MRPRLKPLDEQVIVITGASSGIGLATARMAAARGARLVLAARSTEALDALCRELRAEGHDAVAVTADVAHEGDVERIAATAIRVYGGFDTWVNNAAVSVYATCLDVPTIDMARVLATNLWGTIHGSRVACRHLRVRGGALINVGSATSDHAVPLQGIYSSSKQAIKAWTDALRMELAYQSAPISVTLVKPAPINTPYGEHAANYLSDHPKHPTPPYAPRSAARAILYAAEHPTRDVYVGSSARLLSIATALVPSVVDSVMRRFFIPATYSGQPPRERPILFEPSNDLHEDGDYPGLVRPSLYTAVVTRPALVAAASMALAAGTLAGAWQFRRMQAGHDDGQRRRASVDLGPAVHGPRGTWLRRDRL